MSVDAETSDGRGDVDDVVIRDDAGANAVTSARTEPAENEPPIRAGEADAAAAGVHSGDGAVHEASPPPPHEPARPVSVQEVSRKHWWQRAWAVLGVVVAVVGAVTGVIGVLPILFRDATTPDSLTVSLQAAEAELVSTFAIPLTADWSGFPTSATGCTAEQQAWLESTGLLLHERYLVTVGNRAAEGATLSLKDFRGKGEAASTPPQAIAVVCDRSGSGAAGMRAAKLDPASGRTAVYEQRDPSLPDNPLVFNLTPGESGDFALFVQSSADFTGELVFTASLGGESWPVTLPIEGGVKVPGLATQRLTVAGERLACIGSSECDPGKVIADLLAASGQA